MEEIKFTTVYLKNKIIYRSYHILIIIVLTNNKIKIIYINKLKDNSHSNINLLLEYVLFTQIQKFNC